MVGGGFRKWVKFLKHYGSFLSSLNMEPVYIMLYSWVIYFYLSHSNSICCHTLFPHPKRTFGCSHTLCFVILFWLLWREALVVITLGLDPFLVDSYVSKSIFVLHNVQGKNQPYNHSVVFIPMSVCPHLIHHYSSLSYICFMSLKGDKSWPSFDGSNSYRLQLIFQELDLETIQYLGTYMPQWEVSLHLIVGLHYWPSIKWFLECSTSTNLFTFSWMYWGTLGIIVIIGDLPHTC
jgi:hypothetical protein